MATTSRDRETLTAGDIRVGDIVTIEEQQPVNWVTWRIHRGRRWGGLPEWVELARCLESIDRHGTLRHYWVRREVPPGRLILVQHEGQTPEDVYEEMKVYGIPPEVGMPGYPHGPAVVRNGRVIAE